MIENGIIVKKKKKKNDNSIIKIFGKLVKMIFPKFNIFHNLLIVSPTRSLKWPGSNRAQITPQHIGRLSHATCRVLRRTKEQLSG